MTPSLPTFSIASAMVLPMDSSEFAEIVPTCAMALGSLQGFDRRFNSSVVTSTALSMPRLMSMGLRPEATAFRPSRMIAWASTVAVVVPSPASSEVLEATSSQHLRAHVLEFVFELDLLRNRNTVLRDGRSAVALLEHRVAALRAECRLHRIRKDVDALEHALARIVAKSYFFGCHCRVLRVSYFDSITAMTSSSRMTTSSSPSTFTSS